MSSQQEPTAVAVARAHVEACDCCRDVFRVATAFADDRDALMQAVRTPGAGVVWWRINMRAKRETARAAMRAASFVQLVLVFSAIAIALAILGITIDAGAVVKAIMAAKQDFTLPLIALGVCMLVAPVAVYFAAAEEDA